MAPPEGSGHAGDPIRSVVEVIARALVDHPDAVRVTENERRGMTVYSLTTAPGDMGKIIGRQGRTAAAFRTLVALTAEKHGKRAQLDQGAHHRHEIQSQRHRRAHQMRHASSRREDSASANRRSAQRRRLVPELR